MLKWCDICPRDQDRACGGGLSVFVFVCAVSVKTTMDNVTKCHSHVKVSSPNHIIHSKHLSIV